MNIDGYVKVVGEEISDKLKQFIEPLEYLISWSEAIRLNDKVANKLEDLKYLEEHCKIDIEYALGKSTELEAIKPKFFFLPTKYREIINFKHLERLLFPLNEFWTDNRLAKLFYLNYDVDKFIKFNKQDILDYYFFKSRDSYTCNECSDLINIKPFLNLEGEVFLSIHNYNFIKRFIQNNKHLLSPNFEDSEK